MIGDSPFYCIAWRGSVVECGGKPWRDTDVACLTVYFGLRAFFPRSIAVSPMQGALASLPPHSTTLPRQITCLKIGQL
jgi:hypothetical protein